MPKRIFKGVSFVGISTGVSRLLLEEVATKKELEDFKTSTLEGKHWALQMEGLTWKESMSYRKKKHIHDCKRSFYRKLWRSRYSESFSDGLYRVTKKIYRFEYWATLPGGQGLSNNYYSGPPVDGSIIERESLLMYSHHDEVGNVHFVLCNDNRTIGFKHGCARLENIKRINPNDT